VFFLLFLQFDVVAGAEFDCAQSNADNKQTSLEWGQKRTFKAINKNQLKQQKASLLVGRTAAARGDGV
jgi:hypothetical protein